jgi:hypothetical protein
MSNGKNNSNNNGNNNGNGNSFPISEKQNPEIQGRPDGRAHLGHSTCLLTTPTRL